MTKVAVGQNAVMSARCSKLRGAARRVATPARRNLVVKAGAPSYADTPALLLPDGHGGYCNATEQATRRKTRTVWIGPVPVGSEHPIARQTMTTTNTRDVTATVEQVMRCADAGADIVRITVQGMQEAKAAVAIRDELFKRGYDTPLVADIHFAPKVAMLVAEAFEKIRVNPGNFADGRKSFDEKEYDSEATFRAEVEYIEEAFTPLLLTCKRLGRAIRIGTNHGSMSARTLSYFGDTPRGMVNSAFEFADICRKHDFHNFVFSMKASNPVVMVQAYRLLAAEMYKKGWDYPLHLGVTEAGEGEDGRIKSAIGIGALLMDGLGDTIRVSLTEDPELEMVPCMKLADFGSRAVEEKWGSDFKETTRDFQSFERRSGVLPEQDDGDHYDYRYLLHRDGSVLSSVTPAQLANPAQLYSDLACKLVVGMPFKDLATSDSIVLQQMPSEDMEEERKALRRMMESNIGVIAPLAELTANPMPGVVALMTIEEAATFATRLPEGCQRYALACTGEESEEAIKSIKDLDATMVLLAVPDHASRVHTSRRFFNALQLAECEVPVILRMKMAEDTKEELTLRAGAEAGGMLCDGRGDGLLLEHAYGPDAEESITPNFMRQQSFNILQGSRMRNTKTEYVSCPSCGRTLFDLQETTAAIQEKTGHLPGVAIAVMGCIVNGPGEMADADFGYVGGAPGKIDLYVGKEVVQRAIPSDEACDALVQLIKDHDRWIEPPEEEETEDSAAVAAATA